MTANVTYNSGDRFEMLEAEVPGGTMCYLAGGEGQPVLYLHGAGGLRVTPALHLLAGSGFRLYLPILPGFDGTPSHEGVDSLPGLARLCAEFTDHVIGAPADVAGFAFGGRLALWFAIEQATATNQLVVQSPSGARPTGEDRPNSNNPGIMSRQMFAHPEREPPAERSPEFIVRNRDASYFYHTAGKHVTEAVSRDETMIRRLDEIEALTLLLHGTRDATIGASSVQLLESRIPRAVLVYIDDAAHGVEVDQPERYAALVGDFLKRGDALQVDPDR